MLCGGVYSSAEVDPGEIINVSEGIGDSNFTLSETVTDPDNADVWVEFLNGGAMQVREGDTNPTIRELWPLKTWMNQVARYSTIGELYEVKIATTSGTYAQTTPVAQNVFIDCDANPRWTWAQGSPGSLSFVGIISLREKADTGNVVTATININLTVNP